LKSFSQNQEITNDEWSSLITLLTKEQWTKAEKLSLKYLNKFSEKDDSLADPAILRYMYFRCIAAKLGEKLYDKEEALKKTKNLIGKTIITPPKDYIQKGLFNCLSISEDSLHLFSCSSNDDMTIIQAFETYIMADSNIIIKAKNGEYQNKKLRLGAKIKSIEAGGMMMPRLEAIFEETFIWDVVE
jgi:hypothetical protein